MIDISMIIVSYNTCDLLRQCLESVYLEQRKLTLEVFVVDNASVDGSPEMAEECFPQTHLIVNKENVGFAKANNQAVSQSSGRYVLLLNSDTIVLPGAFAAMLDYMDAHPQVGVLTAKLLNPDGTPQIGFNVRRFPTLPVIISQLLLLDRVFPNSRLMREYSMQDWDHNDTREVEQPAGTCLFVRREVVEQVGMLDEGFFYWYEDVDWCYRIKQAGWSIVFLPEARIVHYGGQSAALWDKATAAYNLYLSRTRFAQKHYKRGAVWLIQLFTVVGMVLRILVFWVYSFRRNKPDIQNVDWQNRSEVSRAYARVLQSSLRELLPIGAKGD